MSMRLSVSSQEFFARRDTLERLYPLIERCFVSRGLLTVRLGPDAIQLQVESKKDQEPSQMRVSGVPQVPGFEPTAVVGVAAKINLPFLLQIHGLQLSHQHIYYLGRDFRSMAEFFMRNYFLGAGRNVALHVQTHAESLPANVEQQLTHEYFFIVKHALAEERLAGMNAKDGINCLVLNTCLQARFFEHHLLNPQFESLEPGRKSATASKVLKQRLLAVRFQMLVHYA